MSIVAEIEEAINKLPRQELWQLKARLDHRCTADWDALVEADARSGGPLDRMAQQAIEEFKAGRCRPL